MSRCQTKGFCCFAPGRALGRRPPPPFVPPHVCNAPAAIQPIKDALLDHLPAQYIQPRGPQTFGGPVAHAQWFVIDCPKPVRVPSGDDPAWGKPSFGNFNQIVSLFWRPRRDSSFSRITRLSPFPPNGVRAGRPTAGTTDRAPRQRRTPRICPVLQSCFSQCILFASSPASPPRKSACLGRPVHTR